MPRERSAADALCSQGRFRVTWQAQTRRGRSAHGWAALSIQRDLEMPSLRLVTAKADPLTLTGCDVCTSNGGKLAHPRRSQATRRSPMPGSREVQRTASRSASA